VATVWWKFHNPNFSHFWLIRPVSQSDTRTDGRGIAYSALSIYAICCSALKTADLCRDNLPKSTRMHETAYYTLKIFRGNTPLLHTGALSQDPREKGGKGGGKEEKIAEIEREGSFPVPNTHSCRRLYAVIRVHTGVEWVNVSISCQLLHVRSTRCSDILVLRHKISSVTSH